ncbi:MAG: hypothetical protein Q8R02_00535 [Hyphomonadaceae bacterium]|nr:hypothetical protein [Hyphomonadaceae bacterium]
MRYRRTNNRLRIVMGAGVLLLLAGAPILLGATRPKAGVHSDVPAMLDVYTTGFHSLGMAGMVAFPLAVIFALWLMAGERKLVNRKYLHGNARDRVNFVASLRTLAILIGAAGLIVGSLSGLYAALIAARPDLAYELPLPFFTFELALAYLLGGGLLYAAGRVGR